MDSNCNSDNNLASTVSIPYMCQCPDEMQHIFESGVPHAKALWVEQTFSLVLTIYTAAENACLYITYNSPKY